MIYFFLGFLFLLLWVSLKCFYIVPDMAYAIGLFWGKFRGAFESGLRPWWPKLIGDLQLYSARPMTIDFEFVINTKEGNGASNQVTLKWTIALKPDLKLLKDYREWVKPDHGLTDAERIANAEKLKKDLVAKIRSQSAILSGQSSYNSFIESHRAIETIMNCVLRLSDGNTPHHHADKYGYSVKNVPLSDRIDFYGKYHSEINEDLKKARGSGEQSEIEKIYGIIINEVSLDPASFSEAMKKALETERKTKQRLVISDIVKNKIIEYVTDLNTAAEKAGAKKISVEEIMDEINHIALETPMIINKVRGENQSLWIEQNQKMGAEK